MILKVNLSGKIYNLTVANNFIKRALGLMFKSIGENEGMIFYYKPRKIHIHTFFMKFPIDVIFLNEDNTVVDIKRNMKPWSTYQSKKYSCKMIEIKSNPSINIKIGDKLPLNGQL